VVANVKQFKYKSYKKYSVEMSMKDSVLPRTKGGLWVIGFLV